MQAIILAGGFGTRLQSVINDVPKPMAPVAGRPFLCWLLEYMAGQGVTEAVLCVHHGADAILSYFGHHFAGIELYYSMESKPLGTGGAIQKVMRQLDPTQPVIVLNGDSLVQLDYYRMVQHHIHRGRQATLATLEVADCSRYSKLGFKNERVVQYDTLGTNESGFISTGFYVVWPTLFTNNDMPQAFSFERDFLHPYTASLRPSYFNKVEYFIDIGIPADYLRAGKEIPEILYQPRAA